MHGENEFLMRDGVLVSITSHGKRRERKIKGEASTPVSGSKNSRMQSQR